ncbi:MAG: hypothetical protein Alis3KO_31760 [Aliiglaciecola sp.]
MSSRQRSLSRDLVDVHGIPDQKHLGNDVVEHLGNDVVERLGNDVVGCLGTDVVGCFESGLDLNITTKKKPDRQCYRAIINLEVISV